MRSVWRILAVAFLFTGCSSEVSSTTTTGVAAGSASSTAPPVVVTTTIPTARSVLQRATPVVVFVETDIGAGSGFVYDSGHVVTSAHVVRPYDSARVVFSAGPTIDQAPVVGWDLVGDLAVLAVDAPSDVTPLGAGSTIESVGGEPVYLVGYPLEDAVDPEPSIVSGVLSRRPVSWDDTGLSFLQTDAAIDNGQSGGLLLDVRGEVLGVTGASRGVFAVALSIEDVVSRVDGLIVGEDVDALEDRLLPDLIEGAPTSATADVAHRADVRAWMLDAVQGDPPAWAEMTSTGSGFLVANAAGGHLVHASGPVEVSEARVDIDFSPPGPYLLVVEPEAPGQFEITASVGLIEYVDLDDGRTVSVGDSVLGVADYAGDIDWATIDLVQGQSIVVRAASASVDMFLFVDQAGLDEEPLAIGSNTAGGPVPFDNEVRYTAEADGRYLIVSSDGRRSGSGAYVLTVSE